MKSEAIEKNSFSATIEHAIAEGEKGRSEILAHLAALPLERLAAVPSAAFSMLGARGLACLAAMRADLPAGIEAVPSLPVPRPAKPERGKRLSRRTRSLLFGLLLPVSLLLAAGPLFERLAPVIARSTDPGWRPANPAQWPACPRLDAYVDGCLYRIGGTTTTLKQVANRLSLPEQQVVQANGHLRSESDVRLERDAVVVVWRGRLQLRRSSR